MSQGTKCHMVLNVTWYYMLHGTICYMVLHVTWYYIFHVTWYLMLHGTAFIRHMLPVTTCYMLLHGTWYYMLLGTTCYMLLNMSWYYMLHGTTFYMVLHVLIGMRSLLILSVEYLLFCLWNFHLFRSSEDADFFHQTMSKEMKWDEHRIVVELREESVFAGQETATQAKKISTAVRGPYAKKK